MDDVPEPGTPRQQADRVAEMRRQLGQLRAFSRDVEAAVAPLAHSLGEGAFDYQAPLGSDAFAPGSYVSLRTPEGAGYVGQVLTREITTVRGFDLGFDLAAPTLGFDGSAGAENVTLGAQQQIRVLLGQGVLLARVEADEVQLEPGSDVFKDAEIAPAEEALVDRYLQAVYGRYAGLEVGVAREGTSTAFVDARGFNRHTFLCGQSGSGKTFALGVLVEQLLLETELPLLILDPNSDFVRIDRAVSLEQLNRTRMEPLGDEEYRRRRARLEEVRQRVHVLRPGATDPGASLAIRFSDLEPAAQAMVLLLDPLADREEYHAFQETIKGLGETYSIADVRARLTGHLSEEARKLALRIENLGVADWELWAPGRPGGSVFDVLDDDWRCLVLDTGTLSTPRQKAVVAQAVLSHLWRRRVARRPLLTIMDEAHNVLPVEPAGAVSASATDYGVLIAGEGRKFGLYLLAASQRPAKIHPNVLSQCENLVLMRMNSTGDIQALKTLFGHVPPSFLEQSSHFSQGESLVAGRITRTPGFVRFGGRLTEEGGGDVSTSWADV